ncbi:MAG: Lrp/AsnC family transcriptional regulator [Saprospiraceae bacterium]|nr:Lrp/AsnC family transcriptional regulator [Saprospiraceae bacterium]
MTDYKLDKLDYRILKILQENSKITNLDLSKMIGLSPAPTLERVKKLEQAGIIGSYHAKLDWKAMGFQVKTFVLVSLNWKSPDTMDRFLDKIRKIDEVTEVYIITGEADALIKIVCKDIPSYETILFKKLSQIEEIERLKSMVTLSTAKESMVLPLQYE